MIFPALKHPSSFHRLLANRVQLVPSTCRLISTRSAINKGLRTGRDDSEPKRGGRDRPQRSSGFADRPRSSSFQRSDAPRRPRDGDFGSGGRDRDRPAFKPRDDVRGFSKDRPAFKPRDDVRGSSRDRPAFKPRDDARGSSRDRPRRDSGSSYARRNEGSDSGGRDRNRPAFKPRDDARSSTRDRPARDFASSSSGREMRDEFKPQGRFERKNSKQSGFAGQPGFSFDKKPDNDFAMHGRCADFGGSESGRGAFDPSRRGSRDDGAPRDRGDRDAFSARGPRFSESGDGKNLPSNGRRDGSRQADFPYDRKPAYTERRSKDSFTPRGRDDRTRTGEGNPISAGRRERDEEAPAGSYSPTTGKDMETPELEVSDRPRKGLLRDIKSACKLIKSIQEAEASGKDTGEMANMANALLRSVNVHVASGNFEDDPSEAVASLFQKKAAEGTFYVDADEASGGRSIFFQRGDGKIELAAKRHNEDVAGARPTQTENSRDRPERSSKVERDNRSDRAAPSRERRDFESETAAEDDGIPISVPFTTAASEFLYGSNAVLAALRGKRRKLYHLYVHPKIFERESGMEADKKSRYAKPAHEFVALAKEANIPFRNEFRTHLLDKMSDGRPHNGVVLEVSKLPAPPVLGLGKPDARKATIPLTLAPQSAEDISVNGDPSTISVSANSWRHPFIIMLDGITDPGNLGNILRTSHFYNVDAVVVATNTCANLSSAVLAKASSGACEAVRILALPQPSNFVHDSAKAGWKIYAAVAPVTTTTRMGGRHETKDAKPKPQQLTTSEISTASPLLDHPCILMLGAEGSGLRENLKARANAFVSISRGQQLSDDDVPDVGVDSMNVSVAAGVLLESFLRKPEGAPEKRDSTGELGF